MEKSDSIKELAIALCEFQAVCPKIKKTEVNPFFKNKYANLASIWDVIRKPLHDNGLSVAQFPIGKCELETVIMHTSGEWMCARYEMKPVKDDPQGAGSVITYQRRYALGSALGLDIDDDDDGNVSSGNVSKNVEKTAVKTEMRPEVKAIFDLTKVELTKVTSMENLTHLWDQHTKTFPELKNNADYKKMFSETREKLTVN